MSSTVDQPERLGRVICQGFSAAHAVMIGAIYLALVHLPLQIVSAINQSVQQRIAVAPGQAPDPGQVALALGLAGGSFLFGLVVFFLFPLIQGGILGKVQDRIEATGRPAESFGAYSRRYYPRLLGSQCLYVLVLFAVMFPIMIFAVILAIQYASTPTEPATSAEIQQHLLANPLFVICIVVAMAIAAAAGMVYWIANCFVVAEDERVFASWRRSLRFCQVNFTAILAIVVMNLVVSAALSPLGLLGQLGIVTNPWALSGLAVIYSAIVGYWGVVLAGIIMSLYLHRRNSAGRLEPAMSLAERG